MFERLGTKAARCTICKQEYKMIRSSTTVLLRHARREHKASWEELQEKAALSQPTLRGMLEKTVKYKAGSEKKQFLDDALVTMICQDLQPLSLVDDKGFLKFCDALDKRYQVPSRMHLRNSLLPEKFDKVQEAVKKRLGLASSVSVTSDLWTSSNNSGFMALTCHWWNEKEGKLDSAILDCHHVQGRHTAEMIQEEAEKVLQWFGIRDKVITFITDNGTNIVKAVRLMGIRRFSCFAHLLNLVVTDSFKIVEELQEARDKVSKVVKLTRQSTVAKERLDEIQKSLGKSPKKLQQDVPTRWNSLYEMFDRFVELKDSVILLLASPGMDKDIGHFSSAIWETISEAVVLLQPCFEATKELSGEKFCTGSKAIPMAKMLMSFYAGAEREADEGTFKKRLAHTILFNLNERFEVFEDIKILALSTLLDPRFKGRLFRRPEKKKNALAFLTKELREAYEKEKQEPQVSFPYFLFSFYYYCDAKSIFFPAQEPAPKKDKPAGGSLWERFDKETEEQGPLQAALPDISDSDLRNYFSLPLEPRSSDPFSWWQKEGKRKFPHLFSLAMKYLSIPATSVPSERVFSAAGEVISKKRNRIGDNNARMLTVLHGNL